MNKKTSNIKLLSVAAGVLLFSVILMIIVALLILTNMTPNAPPRTAGFAVIAAIIIHLVILAGFIKVIRENRPKSKNKNGEYIGLGVLLIIFGLIYMDGAFAYWGDKNTIDLSILMFSSTLCDFVAAVMTIGVFFMKSSDKNKIQQG